MSICNPVAGTRVASHSLKERSRIAYAGPADRSAIPSQRPQLGRQSHRGLLDLMFPVLIDGHSSLTRKHVRVAVGYLGMDSEEVSLPTYTFALGHDWALVG